MVLPHQFWLREFSTSRRVTLGFRPSILLESENMPWSPEAKCVVWARHSAHCSDVAQAPDRKATPRSAATVAILKRITLASCDDVGYQGTSARTMIRNPRAPSQPLVSAAFFCLAATHTLRHPRHRTPPMPSNDPLTLFEEPSGLRQPVLILAFSGWNDAAESATTAARYLGQIWPSEPLATIDPEEFYHFGLSRPHVRFKSGSRSEREIVWPSTDFSLSRNGALDRDLIVGVAMEPHLRWRTYCGAVIDLARRARASLVLTLGAPLALVRRVLSLLGAEADLSDLIEATQQFERNLDEVVGQNPKIAEYVRKLEGRPPDEDEAADSTPPPAPGDELPPSADIVAEIEQFLRQQRPESS